MALFAATAEYRDKNLYMYCAKGVGKIFARSLSWKKLGVQRKIVSYSISYVDHVIDADILNILNLVIFALHPVTTQRFLDTIIHT